MENQRESMEFDVVVVGAGPSGLATAIRLRQLATEEELELVPPGGKHPAHPPAALAQAPAPATPSAPAPQLSTGRVHHTGTLLTDGTVVLAGGRNGPGGG